MSLSTTDLQSPQWNPIYSQEILFASDLMINNITDPKQLDIKQDSIARLGKLNTVDLNYFDGNNETLKTLKHRYPFFY